MLEQKINILLVDDDEVVLRTLETSLKILNYNVYPAISKEVALQVLEDTPSIDVVLLDKSVDSKNGFSLLSRIRASNRKIQVIISSGYFDGGEMEKFKDKGVYTCLKKPFSVSVLAEIINGSINNSNGVTTKGENPDHKPI